VKKKYLNILLIAAIIAIWGYIIQEVFVTPSEEFDNTIVSTKSTPSTKKDSSSRYVLQANYKDPFRMKSRFSWSLSQTRPPVTNKKKPLKTKRIKQQKKIVWPTVEYKGRIKNHSTNNNVAVLKVNGKGYRLSENEMIDELKINSVWKDSVLLVFEGEKKVFTID
tara:strand:- start:37340 stop:37834 length:495 start_codon:yes stop_codon:yes gene_type:complete